MPLLLEDIDLTVVASELARTFAEAPPRGYLEGRTALRDAVAQQLDCSIAEAEELVDSMEARGFLRFQGDPAIASAGLEPWEIVP